MWDDDPAKSGRFPEGIIVLPALILNSQNHAMLGWSHVASFVVCQLAGSDLSAQVPNATVRGTVATDSGRRALEGVEVLIEERSLVVRSGSDGRYRLQVPDTGVVVLLVRHPGYSPVRDTVRLQRSVEVERNFVLVAVPTVLAGVEVREKGGVGNVALRDFERRRKGTGKFLVQADIERIGTKSLESLIRGHIGGFSLVRLPNGGTAVE